MRYLKFSLFIWLVWLLTGCEANWLPDNSLRFNVIFEDAQGVTQGSPLTFQGVTIGDVTNVALITIPPTTSDSPCQITPTMFEQLAKPQVACVSLAVDQSNRNLVRTDSDFMIRSSALIALPDQKKEIEMTIWDSNSPELANGATLIGSNNLLDFYWKQAAQLGRDLTIGNLAIRTELAGDGTVRRTYLLETSPYLPVESILADMLPTTEVGWEVTHLTQAEAKVLQVARNFPSATGVTSKNSDFAITSNDSILDTEYVYTETFRAGELITNQQNLISPSEWQTILMDWYNRLSDNQEDSTGVILEAIITLIDQFKAGMTEVLPLERVVVVITVKMPSEIAKAESNATFVAGNEASWLLTAADLNNGYTLKAIARQGGGSTGTILNGTDLNLWLIGGIVIGIVTIAIGFYLWYRKYQADKVFYGDNFAQDEQE